MGIKHFFHWFKTNFGTNIENIHKGETIEKLAIDNLMIDMNGLFHTSAQKIYQYGSYKQNPRLLSVTKMNNNKNRSHIQQQKVFEDICNEIEKIFMITKPTKHLILCVDGPAPLSKQNQQRQRRFRSAKESNENSPFNSNCITPGTKFMDFLTKYIDWYIRKRISENEHWQKVKVVFSNEKAPGEGEHKIINYIRNYGSIQDTYCISGVDADLIMLALGTHMPNFYILREDMYSSYNDYFCVNIGAIRAELAKELRWNETMFSFNEKEAINDFIFLCFMVGNDFLPHIPSIEIIEKGIELILKVYKETCELHGHITQYSNDKVEFCTRPLAFFLSKIGEYEKENLENKLTKKSEFFTDDLLENCVKEVDDKWEVDIEKYKKEYFLSCFTEHTTEEKVCHDYLEGMQWVLSYYTRGVPNWKWNFRYHYAPCASVLSNHVSTFIQPQYERTIPSTPFQQLLCVMPPKSADLIPEPLCRLLTDKDSPIKKQCPEQFEIDLRGKRKEWEGIVILPMVDFELVRKSYLKLIDKIDKNDLKRNVTGRSFLYEYDSTFTSSFRSYYGDIAKCYVAISIIDL
jgi:5'-3' exoribonuclease 1